MGYGIIGDHIGTTIRDPFPHSLFRTLELSEPRNLGHHGSQ